MKKNRVISDDLNNHPDILKSIRTESVRIAPRLKGGQFKNKATLKWKRN